MNNDPHNDLARYHGFPPLSPPHKPTPQNARASNMGNQKPMISARQRARSQQANLTHVNCSNQPTPTIPQMSDRHEQAILRDKLAEWLTRATVWFSIVSMTLFIASLIYRATVGVY
jgi:hypothetical protein